MHTVRSVFEGGAGEGSVAGNESYEQIGIIAVEVWNWRTAMDFGRNGRACED